MSRKSKIRVDPALAAAKIAQTYASVFTDRVWPKRNPAKSTPITTAIVRITEKALNKILKRILSIIDLLLVEPYDEVDI